MKLISAILALFAITMLSGPALCRTENNAAAPIHIEADRMESHEHQDAVLFTGHVEAKQGDITIRADKMTVYYTIASPPGENDAEKIAPKTTASPDTAFQKVKKIFAKGNVKLIKGDWVASGDTMEFFAGERKVLLSGHAKAWQNKNMVSGDNISLYLDEGKSVVERSTQQGGERVKAFIYPEARAKKAPEPRPHN